MAKRNYEIKPMKKLEAFRKAKGLTQGELAYMCGTNKSAICEYENGKSVPNMYTLSKIAAALGVKVIDLNEYEE